MLKKKLSKLLSIVSVVAICASMSTGMAFAATPANHANALADAGEVPVKLTAPAIADAGIDFSVSESITATNTAGSTAVTYSDLVVTNHAVTGQLQLDQVHAEGVDGWTLKADSVDYFKAVKADTKEISMVTEGQDLSAADKTYTAAEKLVAPGNGTVEIAFSGNVGTFKTALNASQVAKVVPTLSVY